MSYGCGRTCSRVSEPGMPSSTPGLAEERQKKLDSLASWELRPPWTRPPVRPWSTTQRRRPKGWLSEGEITKLNLLLSANKNA